MSEKLRTEKLRFLFAVLILGLCLNPVLAQEADRDVGEEPVAEVDEVIVVTASRTEQKLHDVPATITVISAVEIENAPADDYGDLIRNVPGVNVTQLSARDINVSSRQSAGTLTTGQLVLADGRSLYLDFFGFVMWDYLPVDTREVKQIEVLQGPSSSVWGANAMQGVVNVITKSPREMQGTNLVLGGGELSTAYGSLTHAGVSGKLGYKLSGSYYQQDDPYPRPTGIVPGSSPPTTYAPFPNSGTEQPKVDLRFDYDSSDDTTWSFSTGWAATDGIMHTGIGPFDIDSGASLTYLKGSWFKRAMQLTFFANLLDGDAANLQTAGADGNPLALGFQSETYNLDLTDTRVLGQSHIITYGLNARHNNYDLTIAPTGSDRDEYGVFVQDEILLGDKVRWVIGGRYDDIDPVGSVFSPRTALMFSPTPDHTFRLSYNNAYRAPNLIENHIDIDIFASDDLMDIPIALIYQAAIQPMLPFPLPCEFVLTTCADQDLLSPTRGNPDLVEEQLEALEVGYVGTFGRTTFTAAAYRNELTDATDFFVAGFYNPFNMPLDWPRFRFPLGPTIPAGAPLFLPTFSQVPNLLTYRNVGEIINQGLELSLRVRAGDRWSVSANYSWQDDPEVTGIPTEDISVPPSNRFNFGLSYDADRWYANGNVNLVDDAFWTDVELARGSTASFTQVNVAVGVRLNEDRVTLALSGSNIFDERVQQHVFGDIITRKVTGEVRFRF